jgi:5'-methylthioinosine phosphorylase
VKLAIIGGSLLKEFSSFTRVSEEKVKTPFGAPSDNIITGNINDSEIILLNRHGIEHHIAPHLVNYKANMFALKMLEITHVIAVTAVGGITEKMSPMKCVVPDQIIDYTHGRVQTFNDGNETTVNHIDFSYPFDGFLAEKLTQAIKMDAIECETPATYGVTQGPRLETVAEIKRMERDGCDIVGMTAMPEAALARELEINYANLSLVVNWAAGKGGDGQDAPKTISLDEINQLVSAGNKVMEKVINNLTVLLTKDIVTS